MGTFWPEVPKLAASGLAWIALVLLWSGLSAQQHAQAAVFCGVGLVALWWACRKDTPSAL